MSEPQKPVLGDNDSASREHPEHTPEDLAPPPRRKPVLDVESERRDFGDASDIHAW